MIIIYSSYSTLLLFLLQYINSWLFVCSKLLEFTGFKLTFVQEVYWNAVQRRMVMGQLEYLVEKKEIKDRIPRELAVALMSGDEGNVLNRLH